MSDYFRDVARSGSVPFRMTTESILQRVADEVALFNYFEKLFDLACSQECGSRLTEPVGFIQSQNYPSPYPNNYQCSWIIGADPTGKAYFSIRIFFFISIFSQNLRHGNDKRRRLQC